MHTYRGRTIRRVTEDKWVIEGWRGHSGFTTLAAAIRGIDRLDRRSPTPLSDALTIRAAQGHPVSTTSITGTTSDPEDIFGPLDVEGLR